MRYAMFVFFGFSLVVGVALAREQLSRSVAADLAGGSGVGVASDGEILWATAPGATYTTAPLDAGSLVSWTGLSWEGEGLFYVTCSGDAATWRDAQGPFGEAYGDDPDNTALVEPCQGRYAQITAELEEGDLLAGLAAVYQPLSWEPPAQRPMPPEVPATDSDGDGYASVGTGGTDCDDGNAGIHPGALDIAGNVVDENCSGKIVCYTDADHDGYGTGAGSEAIHASAGIGDTACNVNTTDAWDDTNNDCNDTAVGTNPGATDDAGDYVDENCSGQIVCYADFDDDGFGWTLYGESSIPASHGFGLDSCGGSTSDGWDDTNNDCNDSAVATYPGAMEIAGNTIDENCSGKIVCYPDGDHDGYGIGAGSEAISASGGIGSTACNVNTTDTWDDTNNDCNDAAVGTYPGETEIAGNNIDENCSGKIVCYLDGDHDGYGIGAGAEAIAASGGIGSTACNINTTDAWDDTNNDCNDAASTTNPGATDDAGDNVDENCSGKIVCYNDADSDNYGASTSAESLAAASGLATGSICSTSGDLWDDTNNDCNDAAVATYPGATEIAGNSIDENCSGQIVCYADSDHDGYGTGVGSEAISASGGVGDTACDVNTTDAWDDTNDDCNDSASTTNPGATDDPGNNIDENCSGKIVCYADSDHDGHGAGAGAEAIAASGGIGSTACNVNTTDAWDEANDDCNDIAVATHPGATDDAGNNIDENCSGFIVCYNDADRDGYGASTFGESNLAATHGLYLRGCGGSDSDGWDNSSDDCDDTNAAVNPGASEVCDGQDNNCDVNIDYGAIDAPTWYLDSDGDGFGDAADTERACSAPAGFVGGAEDCDDTNAAVNPGASEVCDGQDNNCDVNIDYGAIDAPTWYLDSDGDGFGDAADTERACSAPAGFVGGAADCDDTNAAVNPGAPDDECSDGVDNDCDTLGTPSYDGDGDGLSYADELSLSLDDCDPDTDGDKVADFREVTALGATVTAPADTDGDGLINAVDPDDDGDTLTTLVEDTDRNNNPENDDLDADGLPNFLDLDDDGDGALTRYEIQFYTLPNWVDSDEDGIWDGEEWGPDADGDGLADDPTPWDTDRDGEIDPNDPDDDGDGLSTEYESGFSASDTDGVPNWRDLDSDGDQDQSWGGTDREEGMGDTDNDRIPNWIDPTNSTPQGDDDGDGLTNAEEGTLGTNGANPDSDGDGMRDGDEVRRNGGSVTIPTDSDADGLIDALDADDDGDSIPSGAEVYDGETDPNRQDSDDDGTPDYLDEDDDNDGFPTVDEVDPDYNGDGVPDFRDGNGDGVYDHLDDIDSDPLGDYDGDGLFNESEDRDGDGCYGNDDTDLDGTPDYQDSDDDNDGLPTAEESFDDNDVDGLPDYLDDDDDGDGLLTEYEGAPGLDTDLDGTPNYQDADDDGDGLLTEYEGAPGLDTDLDGTPNYQDADDDGDGLPTAEESQGDTDGDGRIDALDIDSDQDGVLDGAEGRGDSDGDGIPDVVDRTGDGEGTPIPPPSLGCVSAPLPAVTWGIFLALGLLRRRVRVRAL